MMLLHRTCTAVPSAAVKGRVPCCAHPSGCQVWSAICTAAAPRQHPRSPSWCQGCTEQQASSTSNSSWHSSSLQHQSFRPVVACGTGSQLPVGVAAAGVCTTQQGSSPARACSINVAGAILACHVSLHSLHVIHPSLPALLASPAWDVLCNFTPTPAVAKAGNDLGKLQQYSAHYHNSKSNPPQLFDANRISLAYL